MLVFVRSLCAETSLYIQEWISTELRSQCASVYTPAVKSQLAVDCLDMEVGQLWWFYLF